MNFNEATSKVLNFKFKTANHLKKRTNKNLKEVFKIYLHTICNQFKDWG